VGYHDLAPAPAAAAQSQEEFFQLMDSYEDRNRKRQRTDLKFSDPSLDGYNAFLNFTGITFEGEVRSTRPAAGPDFAWKTSKEDSRENSQLCAAFLQPFEVVNQLSVIRSPQCSTLSLNFCLKGTIADFQIVTPCAMENASILVALELKKDFAKEHSKDVRQVALQLAAATMLTAMHQPVLVLTDLGQNWEFFYFGAPLVIHSFFTKNQPEAIEIIKSLCSGQHTVGSEVTPTLTTSPTPFVPVRTTLPLPNVTLSSMPDYMLEMLEPNERNAFGFLQAQQMMTASNLWYDSCHMYA
jgi:hypothetical protein